jgi:predicted metal-dependent hydrolase
MRREDCLEPPPPQLLVGIEEFNRGEFFECHETLEELWMAEPRQIRKLYQGILQIGVAFYHLRRGRYRAVVTLLERGGGYLRPFVPVCMGLDVAQLLESIEHCLAQVKQLGRDGLNDFDWSLVPEIVIESRPSSVGRD